MGIDAISYVRPVQPPLSVESKLLHSIVYYEFSSTEKKETVNTSEIL